MKMIIKLENSTLSKCARVTAVPRELDEEEKCAYLCGKRYLLPVDRIGNGSET
jgi:hypothetical protein